LHRTIIQSLGQPEAKKKQGSRKQPKTIGLAAKFVIVVVVVSAV
jgi:hypothetical protein